MNLTVTKRVIGGAALTILLLIGLSYTGLNGVSRIEYGFHHATDKAVPMLMAASDNLSSLLRAKSQVDSFHKSKDKNRLVSFEVAYQKESKINQDANKTLTSIAQGIPDLLTALEASQKSIQDFENIVPQVFSTHRQDIELSERLNSKRAEFVALAEELDAQLFDFSDAITDESVTQLLRTMSNTTREISVLVTDALQSGNLSITTKNSNEAKALMAELKQKFSQVQESPGANDGSYYADSQNTLNKFNPLVTGENNILKLYQQQLNARKSALEFLARLDDATLNAQNHINNVMVKIKSQTQSVKQEANELISSSRNWLWIITVIAILVAVVVNFWVLNSIKEPLADIIRIIAKASKGDLTDKARIFRDDEFGTLSQRFNELIGSLSVMLKDISSSSRQLSTSAEQTTIISSQSHENINYQREQTDMIATAMTEMTATVGEVANSANNTLVEVQKANKEAVDGQRVVQESIDTINRLADEIESAASVIDKLNEYSTNIGAVLDVIRGIADQTNLLALNAAIEAARAGEQGRGFAVVADEVRTLASKTQESTSEIQEMIERLQSGTREAVTAMEASRKEAHNSVGQTAIAGDSLIKITQAVSVINDMSTHIASAAEEQSSVTQEMHQNISSISEIADKTSQGASENLAASEELSRLAEHLRQLVVKFRI